MHTHHLGGDHVIENMETYWAQVTYGNILGTSYIRYFSTISLIPSCFPNTSDVEKEKEGDVPMTGHSSTEREREEDENSRLCPLVCGGSVYRRDKKPSTRSSTSVSLHFSYSNPIVSAISCCLGYYNDLQSDFHNSPFSDPFNILLIK